jgi:hypothetical protein
MAHDGAPDRIAQHNPATHSGGAAAHSLAPGDQPGPALAAQREIISALEAALDARQRIIVSRAEVNAVKWSCLYLQAICALLAIALVHCDNRLSSLLAMGLFAAGVSVSTPDQFFSPLPARFRPRRRCQWRARWREN